MDVSGKFADGKLTFCFSGELDHHAAKKAVGFVNSKIDMHMPRDCVLDLSLLRFMDSSGIALILNIHRRMQELDGRLRVENVTAQPLRVLDASGIERLINIKERV